MKESHLIVGNIPLSIRVKWFMAPIGLRAFPMFPDERGYVIPAIRYALNLECNHRPFPTLNRMSDPTHCAEIESETMRTFPESHRPGHEAVPPQFFTILEASLQTASSHSD